MYRDLTPPMLSIGNYNHIAATAQSTYKGTCMSTPVLSCMAAFQGLGVSGKRGLFVAVSMGMKMEDFLEYLKKNNFV